MAALTYYLKRPCGNMRPFCRDCVNSFKVNTCDSICDDGPSVICLEPKIATTERSGCCCVGTESGKFIAVLHNMVTYTSESVFFPPSLSWDLTPYEGISYQHGYEAGHGDCTVPDFSITPTGTPLTQQVNLRRSNICNQISLYSVYQFAFGFGICEGFSAGYLQHPLPTGLETCDQPIRYNHNETQYCDPAGNGHHTFVSNGSYIMLYPIPVMP